MDESDINNDDSLRIGDLVKDMVDWNNPPTVQDLKNDLSEASTEHKEQTARMQDWLDLLHVEGNHKRKKVKGYSNYQPKTIRKQAEWRYGSLSDPFLANQDMITCSPVTAEDKAAAIQNQLLLNTQWRRNIRKTKFIDTYVRQAVDEGTVIVRTGWNFQEEETTEIEDVWESQIDNSQRAQLIMNKLAEEYNADPQAFEDGKPDFVFDAFQRTMEDPDGNIWVPKKVGQQEVKKMRTVANHPTAEIINGSDLILDPTCKGDYTKAEFAIYRFETSMSDLQKNERYENLDELQHMDLRSPNEAGDGEDLKKDTQFKFQDKSRQKFYAYEYWGNWDINGDGTTKAIHAVFVDQVMILLEENPFPHKQIPFIFVDYLPVKESVYGEPDAVLIEDNQHIIGAVSRGMIDLMARSANAQTGIAKDSLDFINRRKFNEGKDYEFNPGRNPQEMFYTHQYPEIPASAYNMVQLHQLEAESMTGTKAFSGGLSGDALGKTSARGVQGVLDAAAIREAGILRRLADGIIQICRHFVAMNAEWLNEDEVVRTTNDEYVHIRKDDLKGEIDIKIEIASVQEDNQKAQELAFMLQTIGPNSDPGEVRLIRAEIARLRKMPDLAKKIEDYRPQPTELEQIMEQIAVAKAQLELQELQSKINKNNASAQKDLADARDKDSAADLKDLNFVEQESGTQHAREVDKITSQADSQTVKSIIESQLPR